MFPIYKISMRRTSDAWSKGAADHCLIVNYSSYSLIIIINPIKP